MLGEVERLRPVQHQAAWDRDVVGFQEFLEIDLVGAADHRHRVVDHRHAFLLGAARETIGVVVDRGGLADEQGVVFGEPRKVALLDRIDLDAVPPRHLGEAFERTLLRGRQRLARVVQHREAIARGSLALRRLPATPGLALHRRHREVLLLGGQAMQRQRPDLLDRAPRPGLDGDFEQRAAEPVEQQQREAFKARKLGAPEGDEHLEGIVGRIVTALEAAVELVLKVGQRVAVQLLARQLQHRLHRRHDAVAARSREQRGVISGALVGGVAREIDHRRAEAAEQLRPRKIVAHHHHLMGGVGLEDVARGVDQDNPVGHS